MLYPEEYLVEDSFRDGRSCFPYHSPAVAALSAVENARSSWKWPKLCEIYSRQGRGATARVAVYYYPSRNRAAKMKLRSPLE